MWTYDADNSSILVFKHLELFKINQFNKLTGYRKSIITQRGHRIGDYAFRNRDEISNSRARFSQQTRGCSIQSQFASLETRNSKELEPKYVPQVFLGSQLGTRRSAICKFFPYPQQQTQNSLRILYLSLATVLEVFAKVDFCGLLQFCLIVFCRTVTTKPLHVTLNAQKLILKTLLFIQTELSVTCD